MCGAALDCSDSFDWAFVPIMVVTMLALLGTAWLIDYRKRHSGVEEVDRVAQIVLAKHYETMKKEKVVAVSVNLFFSEFVTHYFV